MPPKSIKTHTHRDISCLHRPQLSKSYCQSHKTFVWKEHLQKCGYATEWCVTQGHHKKRRDDSVLSV